MESRNKVGVAAVCWKFVRLGKKQVLVAQFQSCRVRTREYYVLCSYSAAQKTPGIFLWLALESDPYGLWKCKRDEKTPIWALVKD
jgi:hypothetical protein